MLGPDYLFRYSSFLNVLTVTELPAAPPHVSMSPCGVGIANAFVIESEGDFCPGKGGFTRLALCATVQEPAL
jgi:hypothetical protein